ncbi:hypothetical protein HPB51_002474 [Rhipicephalus microplus]|uniref:Uncharacterized protein n=1 Tax=Rhipicephalus microplus TaxID=6941 RepID=A0A9J6DEJ1_RHIMP|nr:hypothetical protein HPB51_002474 [Rhipicephalus microplus]
MPLTGYTKQWNDLAGELEKWLKARENELEALKVDYGDEESVNSAIEYLKEPFSSPEAIRFGRDCRALRGSTAGFNDGRNRRVEASVLAAAIKGDAQGLLPYLTRRAPSGFVIDVDGRTLCSIRPE